jgi:uncharacterized repeat protein (TIGR03803 family)
MMRIGPRLWKVWLGRVLVLSAAVLAVASLAPQCGASGATLKTLHSFCTNGDCTDGGGPQAGLIMDRLGHLYGTTTGGGIHVNGTVFELTPNATKTKWTETVLYSFCARSNCTDGGYPSAGLITDASGHLYGTTRNGGVHGAGTVFELTPNAAKTIWTESVLYSFCARFDCPDGALPQAGLIMDAAGRLYGTTSGGVNGTVFELIPNAAKTKWAERVLYSFCAQVGCADGATPYGGVIMDRSEHLYGTTSAGGAIDSYGTVFELTPNATKTKWTETVLHTFCGVSNCADGIYPQGGLIMDNSGRLYGTTEEGTRYFSSGTAFKLTPNSAKTKWTETVLYSFCALSNCTDGVSPLAGLITDASGHLYSTTSAGGAGGAGTVFELTP